MSCSRSGFAPRRLVRCSPLSAAVAALMLAGCSSTRAPSSPTVYAWSHDEPAPVPRPLVARGDIEDDGIEAQSPPLRSIRNLPDDATEPWSRNYGKARRTGLSGEPAGDNIHYGPTGVGPDRLSAAD